jgi:hypothetical protein
MSRDDSFFDLLGELGDDIWELRQHRTLRGLQEQISVNEQVRKAGYETDMGRLDTRIALLQRELATARIALDVLSHAIVEAGVLDAKALDARLQEAMAKYAAKTPAPPVVCTNCGLTYPAGKVTQTPKGAICARCKDL